jgi:hypothetical protein
MACWTVGLSRATNENSAATKTAVPTVYPTPARTSNHSVIVSTSYGCDEQTDPKAERSLSHPSAGRGTVVG